MSDPTTPTTPAPSRRRVLQAGGVGALGLGMAATGASSAAAASTAAAGPAAELRPTLRFRRDGSFRIVQFNDTQDGHRTDARTIELIEAVLDAEDPDLVVFVGDIITGGPRTRTEVLQALNNVVAPVEARGIAWAGSFGNHDEDSTGLTGVDEAQMLAFFRGYRHNVNGAGAAGVTGTGNTNILIGDYRRRNPTFNVWLLDSNRYAPEQIAGQDLTGYPTWDWLRGDQVAWYQQASAEVTAHAGAPVPGLMFVHIPLWEHRHMWFASPDSRTAADHDRAVVTHGIVGERNEDECPGPFNSGMFSAILQCGDVKGVYVGHDHINTYDGDYYGVRLGYGPGTGFAPYGLSGDDRHRLRGARVFTLDENAEDVLVETHPVFAADHGIDLSLTPRPSDPLPLPEHAQG